jgi:mRNA-degrading endonuclease RelE of RelBE toxin-antitoxin system
MTTIEYQELPEFSKEFKKLKKKFKTLSEDFEIARKAAIELYHLKSINNQSAFEIPGLNGALPIFKLKKFACRFLKGRGVKSGIRIIYSWNQPKFKIVFLEIYYKGDKANEDKARIRAYIRSISIDL